MVLEGERKERDEARGGEGVLVARCGALLLVVARCGIFSLVMLQPFTGWL